MNEINAVLFWMSGVVTQSLSAAMVKVALTIVEKPTDFPGIASVLEQLTIGQISEIEFCKLAGQILGQEIEPDQLRQELLAVLTPTQPVLEEIKNLPESYQRWLIVDLPHPWYKLIASTMQLYPPFSAQRLIFLGQSGLQRLVPDLFYYLSNHVKLPANQCLLIDPSMKRAVEGINHGFPTHHYVSPRLLAREFYLRGFTGPVIIHKKPELTI